MKIEFDESKNLSSLQQVILLDDGNDGDPQVAFLGEAKLQHLARTSYLINSNSEEVKIQHLYVIDYSEGHDFLRPLTHSEVFFLVKSYYSVSGSNLCIEYDES